MRTKHLLMTMLLPTVFAACTSDEFESYENNSLSQRKELGQVTFNLSNGEAQTRWDGSFLPEVSDVFGAALVDNYLGENATEQDIADGKKWQLNYEITDYIQTNYPFTYNGSNWASEANLVEGNYVFYAPYSQNHQSRKPIQYQTPVAQTLTVENGKIVANSAMESVAKGEYPFYIAYQFLDAANDNRNISLKMRPIFAYPKFTFKNNKSEAVTITRILVQDCSGSYIVESGDFKNTNVVTKMRKTQDGEWGGSLETNMKKGLKTADLLDNVNYTNLVRADLTSAVTVAKGETAEFSIVLPAMNFAQEELKVYFVTESGKAYTYTNETSAITTVPGRLYPAEDYQLSGELKSSAGQLLTKTVETGEDLVTAPYIVTSKQELIDAINSTPASSASLELTLAGEVDFDSEVLSTIAERLSQPVKFVGDINIIGGTESAPLNIDQKVVFDNATIKSGYVKFNDNNLALAYDNVTVEEGAALSVDKVKTAGTITNKGTLTLNCRVNSVVNNGALVLGNNAAYSSLTNVATSTTKLDGNVSINDIQLVGTWSVPEGKTLTLGQAATLPYGSTLTVEGTLKGAALTVSGTMNLDGRTDANVVVDGTYVANPTTADPNKPAKLYVNEGAIVMGSISGEAAADTEAQFLYIEDNVSFLGTVTNTNLKATYTIEGDVTEDADYTVPSQANTVIITGNVAASATLSVSNSNIKDLTIQGSIIAANGTVSITTATNGKISVKDVLATKDVTITDAKTIKVTGELNMDATFTASSATEVELNEVTVKSNGNVTFSTSPTAISVSGEMLLGNNLILWKNTTLKGDVTISGGKNLTLPEGNIYIDGNLTIDGAVIASSTSTSIINVYGGRTLTLEGTVAGDGTNGLQFVSKTTNSAGQSAVNGKVVNNATITNATADYDAVGVYDWWSGNGTCTPKS